MIGSLQTDTLVILNPIQGAINEWLLTESGVYVASGYIKPKELKRTRQALGLTAQKYLKYSNQ
jgi:hypothetical protein